MFLHRCAGDLCCVCEPAYPCVAQPGVLNAKEECLVGIIISFQEKAQEFLNHFCQSLALSLCCRHIFLFDLAVIVCKRKGDNYEMKEIIDLQQYKIANNPTTDKENKKVTFWDVPISNLCRALNIQMQLSIGV